MTVSKLTAIVLVVAACSSSTRQPEQSSPPTAAPAPADPPPQGSAAKPTDPAAALALLRADIAIICSAAKVTGGTTVIEVGPYIAETMTTAFKVELFADIRNTTLDEFIERIRKGMVRANVQQCDTVEVLIANDPRKRN